MIKNLFFALIILLAASQSANAACTNKSDWDGGGCFSDSAPLQAGDTFLVERGGQGYFAQSDDIRTIILSAVPSVVFTNAGALKTGTTASDTALFQAYDVNDTTYRSFVTLTAGNTPTYALAAPSGASATINNVAIGGTTAAAGAFTTLASSAYTLTSTANPCFAAGPNGATNPTFSIDCSVASAANGLLLTPSAAGSGVTLATISSNGTESFTLEAKGSSSVYLKTNNGNKLQITAGQALFTPGTSNTASQVRFGYTGAADASLTAGTESPGAYFNISQTRTHASNTAITTQRDFRITGSTHAFASSGGVITDGATLSIDGPPIGGANATITNSYGIHVPTLALSNVTNGYGLYVAAPSGAGTVNAAAYFSGNVGIGSAAPEALLEIQGADGVDSVLALDADRGDDNGDTWFIKSLASGNALSILNHTTEVFNLTTAGALQIDGALNSGDAGATRTNLDVPDKDQTFQLTGFIETPEDKTYRLIVDSAYAMTITETVTDAASGTCTATFNINGTPLGGTANSVSSSEQAQAHASANAVSAGDDVNMVISSNSSCADVIFKVEYTRALAQ